MLARSLFLSLCHVNTQQGKYATDCRLVLTLAIYDAPTRLLLHRDICSNFVLFFKVWVVFFFVQFLFYLIVIIAFICGFFYFNFVSFLPQLFWTCRLHFAEGLQAKSIVAHKLKLK